MSLFRQYFPCLKPVVVALALAGGTAAPATAGPAIVFDTATGEVLHAYMATTQWHPASLTKLMTAYVTFQAIEAGRIGLDSTVMIGANPKAPAQGLDLAPGTTFTVEEALPLMLAGSINRVAEALGEAVGRSGGAPDGGSNDAFLAEMNAAADRLGMTGSGFVNSYGWHDPRQVVTARDMAVLTRALIREFPQYQRFFVVRSVAIEGQERRNHNDLLGRFAGADGMKTGYVCESGYNLVGTATREGRRLGAVVLGASSEAERVAEAERLLAAGFTAKDGSSMTLDTIPASADAGPVDMRPYVCGQEKLPAALAGFGTIAPLPRPKP